MHEDLEVNRSKNESIDRLTWSRRPRRRNHCTESIKSTSYWNDYLDDDGYIPNDDANDDSLTHSLADVDFISPTSRTL